jgi:hypothetical protein
MYRNKKRSGPNTRRAHQQNLEHWLAVAPHNVANLNEVDRSNVRTSEIARKLPWIGRFATGLYFDQNCSKLPTGLASAPTLEIAPTSSIIKAIEHYGKEEATRRLGIIQRKNFRSLFYHVNTFELRDDEWSTLLVAKPTDCTAYQIDREIESTSSRLASASTPHLEIIIGSFDINSDHGVDAHGQLTTINKATSAPLFTFGPSSVRGMHVPQNHN